jgi:hypothetical protein
MVAYSNPKAATASLPASIPQEPKPDQSSPAAAIGREEKPSNIVTLVSRNPPAVSIIEVATSALTHKPGAMIEFDDFYLAYWQHCKAIDGRAVAPTEAVQQTNKLCAECGISIQWRGKKLHLVGVRLKSAMEQPEPMAQVGKAT